MKLSRFIIKPMLEVDVDAGLRLSNAEGWNQTKEDWRFLISCEKNVCLVAEYNNAIIGTTTAMNYGNEIAWIGMVLVDESFRGLGIGKLLLDHIFEKLALIKCIKLDATSAGQRVYSKFGFKEEYGITRMVNSSAKFISRSDELIVPCSKTDIPQIIELDKNVFGTERSLLIEPLMKNFSQKSFVIKRNDRIEGFALGREGNKYHHIGPVIASGAEDAKSLVSKALQALENKPVVADVVSDKEDLISFLQEVGFVKQRDFKRMYKNENVFTDTPGKYYLVCGPEFG
jgi:predicted GNAT family N-acyltransferase